MIRRLGTFNDSPCRVSAAGRGGNAFPVTWQPGSGLGGIERHINRYALLADNAARVQLDVDGGLLAGSQVGLFRLCFEERAGSADVADMNRALGVVGQLELVRNRRALRHAAEIFGMRIEEA